MLSKKGCGTPHTHSYLLEDLYIVCLPCRSSFPRNPSPSNGTVLSCTLVLNIAHDFFACSPDVYILSCVPKLSANTSCSPNKIFLSDFCCKLSIELIKILAVIISSSMWQTCYSYIVNDRLSCYNSWLCSCGQWRNVHGTNNCE